jgi:micrococcal nuclease
VLRLLPFRWRLLFLASVAGLVLVAALGRGGVQPAWAAERWRTCVRVVDGDTIILDGGERVRLIGADTPETVHPQRLVERFGREASAFTKAAVLHRRVRLERDPLRPHDKYGRTLGYVFRDDGFFLDAELVKQGYAHAIVHIPHPRMREFRALERDAREHRRGLWGDGP